MLILKINFEYVLYIKESLKYITIFFYKKKSRQWYNLKRFNTLKALRI